MNMQGLIQDFLLGLREGGMLLIEYSNFFSSVYFFVEYLIALGLVELHKLFDHPVLNSHVFSV